MGISATFLRMPVRLSDVKIDQDLDMTDSFTGENREVVTRKVKSPENC
jgi:hypothetical protein